MIAVSVAPMMLLSTPFGRRGFFYRVWSQSQRWLKIQVTAEQCPRLTPDFLAEEMIELGPLFLRARIPLPVSSKPRPSVQRCQH